MAGFDDHEQLVRVTADNGGLETAIREDQTVFSRTLFQTWANDFPFRYGWDEDTFNLFHVSTESLGMSNLPEGRVLLIKEAELRQFPPNLVRCGELFAGWSRAMTAAPSLSWLAAARSGVAATTGKLAAWISAREKQGSTLIGLIERLSDTFEEHGIELDTGAALPPNLTGSDLVIVAAQGSLWAEKRYFQRISDEGDLTVKAADLADALRNVGVVILVVCSGGRADKHRPRIRP